jgi:hypothetical protein
LEIKNTPVYQITGKILDSLYWDRFDSFAKRGLGVGLRDGQPEKGRSPTGCGRKRINILFTKPESDVNLWKRVGSIPK